MRGRTAYRRLSRSTLWAAQRRYYERAGIGAWQTATVPHHVTSNVALATAYARVVLAFAREHSGRSRLRRGRPVGGLGGRPEPPIYLIELGAGSGRFAFLFLRALDALQQHRDVPVRYVMTDVSAATMRFWRGHEALAPFLRARRLDFARFDAECDDRLRLERERRTIAPDARAARLVVIANYVFSGLRHDAFDLRGRRVYDYLVAAGRPRGGGGNVSLTWRQGALTRAPYEEDDFNAILRDDATRGGAGRLLFPVGALRCLDRLAALAREDVLVLAADRGTVDAGEALTRGPDLGLGRHGAVSFPVNFHALRTWTTRRGGQPLRPPHGHRHVHIAGFLLGGQSRAWDATRAEYDDAIATAGPDELYALRRGLSGVAEQLGPAELLALMRLCGPDPRVVAECIRPLWPHLADADAALRRDIRDAVLAAWPNYYHLGEAYDLPFNLALVLYEVRAYAEAKTLFDESVRLYGEDAATRWNLGLCHVALGKPDEARAAFARSRMLAPGLHPAGPVLVKLGPEG